MIGSIITEVKSIDFSELGEQRLNAHDSITRRRDFPMTPQTLEVTDGTKIELLKKCVKATSLCSQHMSKKRIRKKQSKE